MGGGEWMNDENIVWLLGSMEDPLELMIVSLVKTSPCGYTAMFSCMGKVSLEEHEGDYSRIIFLSN